MKRTVTILLFALTFFTLKINSQVSTGGIAFIVYNTDGDDNWAFVALQDIPSGETLNFTTIGWAGSAFYGTSEETISVTTTSTVSAGTVVSVNGTTFSPSIGSVSGVKLTPFAGDQILCYQGTSGSPTFIAAINGDYNSLDYVASTGWNTGSNSNTTSSALPTGLTNGINAISLYPGVSEVDNARYNCTLTSGTGAELLAAINNKDNWVSDNGTAYASPCTTSFTVTTPVPVELISFNALLKDQTIELNWETATEINNYGFEIERSNERENWEKIGFVNGFGNSNSPKSYSFIDGDVEGGNYQYRLKQIDYDGQFEYSPIVEISFNKSLPKEFALDQNYPNPFNPVTEIKFRIPDNTNVSLKIYDLLGGVIIVLVDDFLTAGEHKFSFDASELSSGSYFYKLETPKYSEIKKMIVLK